MSNSSKYTIDEHFLSRMYLKGFSEVKGSGNKEKAFVWQYNLKTMQQTPTQVNISRICFEKNLYEIRDKEGAFVARNTIEKSFEKIESQVNTAFEAIKRRTQDENCMNCTTFFTDEEKSLLTLFITSLMYRDPTTIERGISYLKENNPEITYDQARNFTLLNLLPLGIDQEWDQNTIIRTAIENLSGMAFQLGLAQSDVIFTTERPFVMWPSPNPEFPNRPKALVFPFTSKLVLYMYPIEDVDPIGRNYFFQMDEGQIQQVQENVAICAKEWLYSREKLTKQQQEVVKEARKNLSK